VSGRDHARREVDPEDLNASGVQVGGHSPGAAADICHHSSAEAADAGSEVLEQGDVESCFRSQVRQQTCVVVGDHVVAVTKHVQVERLVHGSDPGRRPRSNGAAV
jgi:hypothetical protein